MALEQAQQIVQSPYPILDEYRELPKAGPGSRTRRFRLGRLPATASLRATSLFLRRHVRFLRRHWTARPVSGQPCAETSLYGKTLYETSPMASIMDSGGPNE